MSKSIKEMNVFSKEWFSFHQKYILRFANTWVGRKVLRIHSFDLPGNKNIVAISPNSFTWKEDTAAGRPLYKVDIRSHEKFGKRLYYGLKPLWWILHYTDDFFTWFGSLSVWDLIGIYPRRVNFGFDTLIAYPAAGENSPVDGKVRHNEVQLSWSALRGGAGTDSAPSTPNDYFASIVAYSNPFTDTYADLQRSIFCFDTTLPGGAVISSSTFSVFGTVKQQNLGDIGLGLVAATPSSYDTLVPSDYSNLDSVRLSADITYSGYNLSAYNDFVLNSSGLSNINKAGISAFGLRSGKDIDNSAPSWISSASSYFWGRYADIGGTTEDPKIVITYTIVEFIDLEEGISVTDSIETNLFQSPYDQEAQKLRGAFPVWILKCPFPSTGTIYISDQVFTIAGWDGGITTKNWIRRWGQIDEDIESQQAATRVSDLSLDLLINPADDPTIHDILWTEANGVETVNCELYLWFKGIDAGTSPPRMKWAGNIVDYKKIDELGYTVQLIDQSVMVLSQPIGSLLSIADYPNADPDDIGKAIPIIYGSVAKAPALAVDAGWITTITEDISDSDTDIEVSDASGLEDGDVIQAEDEKIEIGTVSGNTLLSCTRAHDSTIATTHDKGISIGKIQTEYWYLIADHPVKAIGDIYVDGVRQTGGDFTKYIDHSGQAKVKFTALPLLRKSVDVEVDDNAKVTDYTLDHNDGINHNASHVEEQTASALYDYPYDAAWVEGVANRKRVARFTHPGIDYDQIKVALWARPLIHNGLTDDTIYIRLRQVVSPNTVSSWQAWAYHPAGGSFDKSSSVLLDFTAITTGDIEIEAYHESSGTEQLVEWDTISCTRTIVSDAGVIGTGAASKTDAIKDKIDGGKAYYVGLIGNSSADTVIGTRITANVDGYEDDGPGTYTGTPNALIEQPDHVIKHILNIYGGLPVSSFYTDASADFLSKGYKFAGLITEYPELKGLVRALAWQCRCWFRFSEAQAQLLYRPDSLVSDKTITPNMVRMDGDTGRTTLAGPWQSPLTDVLNEINLHYDRDWSKDGEDAYQALEAGSDSNSVTKYGLKANKELFFFDFVRESAMATDLVSFYIARYKDRHKEFSLETHLYNEALTFADGVELEMVDNLIVELMKVNFYPGSGRDMRVDRITLHLMEY